MTAAAQLEFADSHTDPVRLGRHLNRIDLRKVAAGPKYQQTGRSQLEVVAALGQSERRMRVGASRSRILLNWVHQSRKAGPDEAEQRTKTLEGRTQCLWRRPKNRLGPGPADLDLCV